MSKPLRPFVCELCGERYLTASTEEESNREFLHSGMPADGGELHAVCDACYAYAMARAREAGLLE